ncbi:hypothetical protein TUSST3_39610 [Streptomyces sp. TUS-ST3]|nr:hypothetical protein TUSST3_39610 [Streptomyces sp. TUS-ST3]
MFMAVLLSDDAVDAGRVGVCCRPEGDGAVDAAGELSVHAVTASSRAAATAPRAARAGRAVGITGRPGIQSERGSE